MSCYEVPTNIAAIVGPMLVGYTVNGFLFGILSVQVYNYYLAFSGRDRWPIKTFVYCIYSIEIAQTIMTMNDAFNNLARGFGDVEGLTKVGLTWLYIGVMGALVASAGQFFYAYRIMVISRRSMIPPTMVVLTSLVQCGAGLATGIQNVRTGSTSPDSQRKTVISITVWLAGSVVCDALIVGFVIYYLRSAGKSTSRETQLLVAKIIRLSIETGAVTAIVMSLGLLVFLVLPHDFYYPALALTYTKWYSNTILVVLNSRMRKAGEGDGTIAIGVTTLDWTRTTNWQDAGTESLDLTTSQLTHHCSPKVRKPYPST